MRSANVTNDLRPRVSGQSAAIRQNPLKLSSFPGGRYWLVSKAPTEDVGGKFALWGERQGVPCCVAMWRDVPKELHPGLRQELTKFIASLPTAANGNSSAHTIALEAALRWSAKHNLRLSVKGLQPSDAATEGLIYDPKYELSPLNRVEQRLGRAASYLVGKRKTKFEQMVGLILDKLDGPRGSWLFAIPFSFAAGTAGGMLVSSLHFNPLTCALLTYASSLIVYWPVHLWHLRRRQFKECLRPDGTYNERLWRLHRARDPFYVPLSEANYLIPRFLTLYLANLGLSHVSGLPPAAVGGLSNFLSMLSANAVQYRFLNPIYGRLTPKIRKGYMRAFHKARKMWANSI